jgi:superfamily II DNA or RNA helicase
MNLINNYTPFEFQIKNVELGTKILDENGGLAIFDETGLGKTVSATMVVLNSLSVSNLEDINLLVISPISNIPTWNNVLSNTSIKYTVCNIEKLKDNKTFTHIIVDEAHNFRSIGSSKYQSLYKLIHSQNKRPDVILTTATPFNNTYSELKYIFALIPFKSNSYPFINLGFILNNIISYENEIDKLGKFNKGEIKLQDITKELKIHSTLNYELKCLRECLGFFAIRNTRKGIEENFPNDIKRMGAIPNKVYNDKIELDLSIGGFFHNVISLLSKAPLIRQNVEFYSSFFKDPKSHVPLFFNILGKRMDSSHYAFHKTLERSINELIELNEYYKSKNVPNPLLQYGKSKIEVSIQFWKDLLVDLEIFKEVHKLSLEYMESELYHEKAEKLLEVIKNHDGKLVIFTEYSDTMEYLDKFLKENCTENYIDFNSKISSKQIENIIMDFDANIHESKQTNKYKFVLATDVLSEGISMHRADKIVHYDCRWNPARIKQRNGRIDRIRIGNMNPSDVYIDTFATNITIESYIGLDNKIDTKSKKSETILNFDTVTNFNKSNYYNDTKGIFSDKINETLYILHTSQRDIVMNTSTNKLSIEASRYNITNSEILEVLNDMENYDLYRTNDIWENGKIIRTEYSNKYNEKISLRSILDNRSIFHTLRNSKSDIVTKFGYLSNQLYSDFSFKILNAVGSATINERIEEIMKHTYDMDEINTSVIYINKNGTRFTNIIPKK